MVDYSLSEHDIRQIINGQTSRVKYLIKPYDYLNQFTNIEQLMDKIDGIVILYFTAQNYGHFTCLTKSSTEEYYDYIEDQYGKGKPTKYVLTFFDPLGILVDNELKFVPKEIQKIKGEEFPHLRELLRNSEHFVEWNNWKVQKDARSVTTCGRWCAQRVVDRNVPLKPWVDLFLHKKESPDSIIVKMTSPFLPASGGMLFGSKAAHDRISKKFEAFRQRVQNPIGGARKPRAKRSKTPKHSRRPSLARGATAPKWGKSSFVNENVINIIGEKAPDRRRVRGSRPIRYQNEMLSSRDPTVKVERGPRAHVHKAVLFPPTVALPSQAHYVTVGNTAAANALASLSNQLGQVLGSSRDLRTRNAAEQDWLRQATDTHVNDVLERREAQGRMLGSERARGQALGVNLQYASRPVVQRQRARRGAMSPLQASEVPPLDTTIYDADDHARVAPYQHREQPPPQPYESNGIAIVPTTGLEPQIDTGIVQAQLPPESPVHAVDEPFRRSGDRSERVVHFLPSSQLRGLARPRVEQVESQVPPEPPAYAPPLPPSRTRVVAGTGPSGFRVQPLDPLVLLSEPQGSMRGRRAVEIHRSRRFDDEDDLEYEEMEYDHHQGVAVPKDDRTATHTATTTRVDTGHIGDDGPSPLERSFSTRDLARRYLEAHEEEDSEYDSALDDAALP